MTTEDVVATPEQPEPKPVDKSNMDPHEFLASLPGAPTKDMIAAWKQQAPNNRLEVFTPDGKRAYIVRGLTGLELTTIQKQIQSMATPVADPELEMQLHAVVKAVVWTNAGQNGKLTDVGLRTGAAGLPATLFTKVTKLSDFMDPQQIEFLSAEL
jgi:hypothetical protein